MTIQKIMMLVLILTFSYAKVITLDNNNIDTFIEQNPFAFIQFYSSTCDKCKDITPQFQKLAENSEGAKYVIAKIDISSNKEVATQFEISPLPGLKLFAKQTQIIYQKARTAEQMKQWIESYFKTRIIWLNQAQFKAKQGKETFVSISGASEEQMKILEIANFIDEQINYFRIPGDQYKLTLYRPSKNPRTIEYDGNLTVDDLTKWTYLNTVGDLVYINKQLALRAVFQNRLNVPVYLLYKADDLSEQDFKNIQKVCEENRLDFKCGYADNKSFIYQKTAKYLKLNNYSLSALAFLRFGLKQGYIFTNITSFTNQSIFDFNGDIREGRILSFIDNKPAQIVQSQSSQKIEKVEYKQVLKLTVQTYRSVIQSNKYVFVEYYSSNCFHCIQFAPQYQKLANQVKSDKLNYIIAAVDMVAEKDVSKLVKVKGYPTLRLYVNEQELNYKGNRDAESILQFINKAASTKLKTVSTVSSIKRPFIAISGIPDDSPLHKLPLFYTQYPIYHIQGKHQLKIEAYMKNEHSQVSLNQFKIILDWLEEMAAPTVITVADQTNSKKLAQSIQRKYPLLVVVQRDETVKQVLSIFQNYCPGRYDVVCGTVLRQSYDYESFNKWLNDQNKQSVLVIIDTTDWTKHKFQGDLQKLTQKSLQNFVTAIQTKIKKNKNDKTGEQQQTNKKPGKKEKQIKWPEAKVVIDQL